jgi:hypothetical protein
MKELVCIDCYAVSEGAVQRKGSTGIESLLAIAALGSLVTANLVIIGVAVLASLAYSSYRRRSSSIVCPSCDGRMIETNSPRGREIVNANFDRNYQANVSRERETLREQMGRNDSPVAMPHRVL